MLIFAMILVGLVRAEYYTCSSAGNACKVGTTCCKRSDGKYGCCPLENGICCNDGEGHCCPYGFPVCDIPHKRCTDHLSMYLGEPLKSDALDYKDAFQFLYGLGSGLGIRLDQYVSCTEQLSISITLFFQASKYMTGSTTLDNLIMVELIGEGLQHLSMCTFNCMGAVQTSMNFFDEFFEEIDDNSEFMWKIIENIGIYGNYIYREYAQISEDTWEGKGYRIGKMITYLFRIS